MFISNAASTAGLQFMRTRTTDLATIHSSVLESAGTILRSGRPGDAGSAFLLHRLGSNNWGSSVLAEQAEKS